MDNTERPSSGERGVEGGEAIRRKCTLTELVNSSFSVLFRQSRCFSDGKSRSLLMARKKECLIHVL